jgi:hypothetical protein
MHGEQMLTLDQAMARAGTAGDLWHLWAQAPTPDKIIIEKEMLSLIEKEMLSRGIGLADLQKLKDFAYSEEVRKAVDDALLQHEQARQAAEAEAKRQREERQAQAQKKAEEIRLALKEARQRLIREAGGRLDDKSAEEVKRLVDNWRTPQGSGSLEVIPSYDSDIDVWVQYNADCKNSFHAGDFYKAFGRPERKQLISGDGVFNPDHYYFYYECKDGTAQIEIDATSLSKENLVLVSGLNIL